MSLAVLDASPDPFWSAAEEFALEFDETPEPLRVSSDRLIGRTALGSIVFDISKPVGSPFLLQQDKPFRYLGSVSLP